MILKLLGGIDLLTAIIFLALIFGADVFFVLLIFSAALLLVKGMFVFRGDILSTIDIFSAVMLILAVFTMPYSILLWIPAFLLLAKGIVSFL